MISHAAGICQRAWLTKSPGACCTTCHYVPVLLLIAGNAVHGQPRASSLPPQAQQRARADCA